jgi:hypothetical protein
MIEVCIRDPPGLDDDDFYYGVESDCGNDNDGGTDLDRFDGTGCNGTACGGVTNPTANLPSPTMTVPGTTITVTEKADPGVAGLGIDVYTMSTQGLFVMHAYAAKPNPDPLRSFPAFLRRCQ